MGVGPRNLVDLEAQIRALQARNLIRLLEPEAPGSSYSCNGWAARLRSWPHVTRRALDAWGQGAAALFTSVPLHSVPQRVAMYVAALCALRRHCAGAAEDMYGSGRRHG